MISPEKNESSQRADSQAHPSIPCYKEIQNGDANQFMTLSKVIFFQVGTRRKTRLSVMTVHAVSKTQPCLQRVSHAGRQKPVATVAYMNGCRTTQYKGCKELHTHLFTLEKLDPAFTVV